MTTAAATGRAFGVWFRHFSRWDPASYERIRWHWPSDALQPIGSVLMARREKVDRTRFAFKDLRPITIHFDGTIDPRNVDGNREYTMDLFFARPGDVVVAKIDLKNGAVAVIPDDWDNVAVTGHFAVYEPDRSRIIPEYLCRVIQSSFFKAHLWRNKVGAEGRKEVKLDFFEAERIPIPTLPVQRAIMGAWERGQRELAATRAKIAELEERIEADFLADLGLSKPARATLPKCFAVRWKDLLRWSVMFNQLSSVTPDISTGKHAVATLGNVAAVSYGIQKCPANRPGQHARPYLRVANVQRGELDLREMKYINVPDKEMPSLRVESGDLLVCEGNSADLVGRPAIWRDEIPDCVHQNHILKVRCDRAKALPDYVLEYMQTPPARNHFRARAKFTTNLASINSNDLREMPLPLPPLARQRELADKLAQRRAEIAALRTAAAERERQAKADVEAMILGRTPPAV